MNITQVPSPNYTPGRSQPITKIVLDPSMWYNVTMVFIYLSRGFKTIVDDIDGHLSSVKWSYTHGYARRQTQKTVNGKIIYKKFYLHRVIMKARKDELVDHIDGDGLNNKRSNLRLSNKGLNALNSKKCKSKTGYRNVTWSNQRNKYQGTFKYNKKAIHCGFYTNPKDAFNAVQFKKKEIVQWL